VKDQPTDQALETTFPGNVLVAACGFIVTGAGWGLFGYLEGDLAATGSSGLFFLMALTHIATGALIFYRLPVSVPIGVALAAAGLVIAVAQPQYVLIFTNIVILGLLILARSNVAAGPRAV
jgi:hypothetical protein